MGYEFEMKYASTQAQQAEIAAALGQDFQVFDMETTYYDTPCRDLSARRWTLRRRYENGSPVCTLKTPAGKLGRGEWDCAAETIEDAIAGLVRLSGSMELAELAAQGLEPICGARFRRKAYTAAFNGTVVEIAVDSGILFGGSREAPICEVEVELKDGSREDAARYAAGLAERFGLVPEPKSKFRRALELTQSG